MTPWYTCHMTDEYMAGLFDGEGCVCITKSGGRKSHGLRVSVAMTHAEVLQEIPKYYGGKVYGKYFRDNPNWKPQLQWGLSGQEAIEFLNRIYPFLIVKKPHAEVAFQFEGLAPGRGRGGWTPANKEKAEQLRLEMAQLNYRGVIV